MSTASVIGIAVVIWFAIGWQLNTRLDRVHARLDQLFECFNGLREYLYENDPQFDDERELLKDTFSEDKEFTAAPMLHLKLIERKKNQGHRTLNTSFLDGGFRAPDR